MTTDAQPDHDDLLFAEETAERLHSLELEPWKVMVVDDEEEIHSITRLVLGCGSSPPTRARRPRLS